MSEMPKGLPPIDPSITEARTRSAIDAARICPHCKSGKGVRIVSNSYGVHAHCGPCKRHWPISSAPLAPELPPEPPRGLHKETLVEPNWDKAFDEIEEDVTNEQVGPRKK